MTNIDTASPVPRYFQLKEILLEQIRTKALKAGELVPPERVLCETYGLARMTVRQAVSLLVEEGYLVRKRGSGTFVASSRVNYPLYRLRGFTEEMSARGFQTTSLVVESKIIKGENVIRKKLNMASSDCLQMITRVRRLKDDPFAIETNYVSTGRCPGLLDIDLTNASLYSIYEKKFRIKMKNAAWTLEAVTAKTREASLLEIKKSQPLLLMEGITKDIHGQPVEFVKGVYRNDRYKFSIEMAR